MKRGLARQRLLASAAVLLCAAIAFATASSDGTFVASPDVAVVDVQLGSSATGSATLTNAGSSAVTVGALAQAPCDDADMTVTPAPPFAIGSGSARTVAFQCPASTSYGMRRCTYHVQDSALTELAIFMGVCETAGSAALMPDQTALSFVGVPVGTTQTQTIHFTNVGSNGSAVGKLQLQTTDLDGVVLLGAPCSANSSGCDVASAALGGFSIDVICHPASATSVTSSLYVVDELGDKLAAPVSVSCAGVATAAATIDVTTSPSPLSLGAVEVVGGAGSGTVHVRNVGTTDTLVINAIAISGAGADWTYTIGTACNGGLPCSLAPGVVLDIAVRLTPSALGTRSATMTISSNDANNTQVDVQLVGTGQGATLALASGSVAAIDMGQVNKNASASIAVNLVNKGNRAIADAELALAGDPQFSTMPASPASNVVIATGVSPTPIMLTCTPGGVVGDFTATLTASAADTLSTTPITVNVTCHGTDSELVAQPPSLQLGEVRTTTTTPPTAFALANLGSMSLTLAQQPALAPAVGALSLSPLTSLAIASMGSAAVSLSIDPQTDGALTTSITAADTSGNNSVTIPVTGKIVTASASTPTTVTLGSYCVSQPTTPTTIALASTGTATLALLAPAMATAPSPFQIAARSPASYPATLAAQGLATIDVLPSRQGSAMTVVDDVVWSTDIAGSENPHTTVSATFVAAGAAISPAKLQFDDQSIHLYNKDAQPVTIQNCSGPTIALTLAIDPPFSIDSDYPTTLASGESATFAVGFHPTNTGTYDKTLRITASDQPTQVVALEGTGVANGSEPDGGLGSAGYHETSFYACSCSSGADPSGGIAIVVAIAAVVLPISGRRRRGSSSAR